MVDINLFFITLQSDCIARRLLSLQDEFLYDH